MLSTKYRLKIRLIRLFVWVKQEFADAKTYTRSWKEDPTTGLFLSVVICEAIWILQHIILAAL